MISRRMFIKGMCGCALGVTSIASYSRLLEPRWVEINNVTIKINALPKQFEGMTIAQLSDIHHCKYVPRGYIRRCVQKVNALSPDIIALTGDYINNPYDSQDFLVSIKEELTELKSKEGVFAVSGNHDIENDIVDVFSKTGIQLLINKHIPLFRKKDHLFIVGVGDLWKGRAYLHTALQGTDHKPKILLAHNPDTIEWFDVTDVDFVMAGHTHGGQVSLPLYGPPITYSKFGYTAGLFRKGKTLMYVNKGIGISGLPVRFLARPEITLFTLRNSNQIV